MKLEIYVNHKNNCVSAYVLQHFIQHFHTYIYTLLIFTFLVKLVLKLINLQINVLHLLFGLTAMTYTFIYFITMYIN